MTEPIFSIRRDNELIRAGTHFWCETCVVARPLKEQSPDPRYCQGCYEFLLKEAELLGGRKPTWAPKDSQPVTRRPPEPVGEPVQPASGVGHNYIGTRIGSGIMSTLESKKDDGKRGPKHKALPRELIKQWAGEGMGSRAIASRLNNELGIEVSYKTVQRALAEGDYSNEKRGLTFESNQSKKVKEV